jgi:hypothetical protein
MVIKLREKPPQGMRRACRGVSFWRIDLHHKTWFRLMLRCPLGFGLWQAGIRP